MHLWSLGIEEQFYLFFPVLLVVLWRIRFSLWLAIAGMVIISFAANLYWMGVDAAGAFFLPHTRFWELLAGGLLAYGEVFKIGFQRSNWPRHAARDLVARPAVRSWIGLFLLVTGMLIINKGSQFPGVLGAHAGARSMADHCCRAAGVGEQARIRQSWNGFRRTYQLPALSLALADPVLSSDS